MNDMYVKAATDRLKTSGDPKTSVLWLDSNNPADRKTLGVMFQYCTNLFGTRGIDRNCVVQCHPKVDCGAQSARLCQHLRTEDPTVWAEHGYKDYVVCADRERQFCERFGAFNGESFPSYTFAGDSDDDRILSLEQYCANLFQYRGLKLPCLRDCTIYTMRAANPDRYAQWKASTHLREYRGRTDPSERLTVDPDHASYTECEDDAMKLCRFLRTDYWRECYERVKMKCLLRVGNYNPMLKHVY